VLELKGAERTLIADYSTGMRKKIGLAVAVLHGPRVLVLDEPFEAIDPVSAAVVRAILDGFTAAGGTVVMSSHAMALVERLCDHVAVLAAGQILRSGTLAQVRGLGRHSGRDRHRPYPDPRIRQPRDRKAHPPPGDHSPHPGRRHRLEWQDHRRFSC
jgi:ABC-type multidrug transport system ATPase subunit